MPQDHLQFVPVNLASYRITRIKRSKKIVEESTQFIRFSESTLFNHIHIHARFY